VFLFVDRQQLLKKGLFGAIRGTPFCCVLRRTVVVFVFADASVYLSS
jgi:hypothetical protein